MHANCNIRSKPWIVDFITGWVQICMLEGRGGVKLGERSGDRIVPE